MLPKKYTFIKPVSATILHGLSIIPKVHKWKLENTEQYATTGTN